MGEHPFWLFRTVDTVPGSIGYFETGDIIHVMEPNF